MNIEIDVIVVKKQMSYYYYYYYWINRHKQNKQDSEYASGPQYTKLLNMAKFSISERYTAFWICQNMPWQSSEYVLGSKYGRVVNIQELHRVLNVPQYGWIYLNRPWICLSEFTIKRQEHFATIIIVFNYFCKKTRS